MHKPLGIVTLLRVSSIEGAIVTGRLLRKVPVSWGGYGWPQKTTRSSSRSMPIAGSTTPAPVPM
ncbi:hypothetical protein MPLDJ20_90290 [Mesorhizobium plurifarium]|uniref:Uncharacterized protein n=1 Tax=Mesorhizobium plurifarium TaxID=69974 RepID=A0A090FSR8_MESPL|nr:hypothetical protein MPLDJ20_90290 [Mesorhizobium plurifarium]